MNHWYDPPISGPRSLGSADRRVRVIEHASCLTINFRPEASLVGYPHVILKYYNRTSQSLHSVSCPC